MGDLMDIKKNWQKTKGMVPSLIGFAVGIAVVKSCGLGVFIPIGIMWGTYFVFKKWVFKTYDPILFSFSVQFGQSVWIIMGGFLSGFLINALADWIFVWSGLIWFRIRPGRYPLIFLMIFQFILVFCNIKNIMQSGDDVNAFNWLCIHILFRVFAIIGLIGGLINYNTNKDKTMSER
jgi:hypothetical protein